MEHKMQLLLREFNDACEHYAFIERIYQEDFSSDEELEEAYLAMERAQKALEEHVVS